jgi:hypothetical protein
MCVRAIACTRVNVRFCAGRDIKRQRHRSTPHLDVTASDSGSGGGEGAGLGGSASSATGDEDALGDDQDDDGFSDDELATTMH